MKDFKAMTAVVLSVLGLDKLFKIEGKFALNAEQKEKLTAQFGEKFVSAYEKELSSHEGDDKGNPKTPAPVADAKLLEQITGLQTQLDEATAKLETATEATAAQKAASEKTVSDLQAAIKILSEGDEAKPPAGGGSATDDKVMDHTVALFGMTENSLMALEGRPWNQRAAQALAERQGIQISASSSIDYSKLSADLGEYYRTRRDTIHSMVQQLPTVEGIFPLQSGYQDQNVLLNAFLGEFSQSFQDAFTPKGTYEIEPEIIKMFDVKFDHKFSKLKQIEKQWIGYLNKEGSNAMKWSFIEFLLAETAKKLHNEREIRRVSGKYVAPVNGEAGPSVNGADGFRTFIKNKVANLQIKPFVLGEWTPQNIVEYIFEGSMMLPQNIRDTGKIVCYLDSDAVIYYEKNFNSQYGKDSDYKGDDEKVKFLKSITLKGVPYMGGSKRVVWSVDGNICTFEDKPNEMLAFEFEQEDRTLKVWSDWKESVWAFIVGKKWSNVAEMDYEHQLIWCNDVDEAVTDFISVLANDTTPSVSVHTSIKTGINTAPTVITTIDDMEIGDEVIVKCGSDNANNSTIAAAGDFSAMTAAWNPSIGDTITLFKRGANDIIDLDRTTASSEAEVIAADDTTPDVADANLFVTSANTGATAITALDNATEGETYIIYGGSDTHPSTIADSGQFDLTGAMTLNSGSFIELYARGAADFVEKSRG